MMRCKYRYEHLFLRITFNLINELKYQNLTCIKNDFNEQKYTYILSKIYEHMSVVRKLMSLIWYYDNACTYEHLSDVHSAI